MAISKKLIKYLENQGFRYELVDHKTTFTAWDMSQTKKLKPQQIVKCLVVKADNDYLLALLSANRNLDKAKLLKIVNTNRKKEGLKAVKKIELANESWMKMNVPGKVGATPPFGKMVKLAIYFDSLLSKNRDLFVGSGDYTASIKIKTSDYLKHEQPIKGSFSCARKKRIN